MLLPPSRNQFPTAAGEIFHVVTSPNPVGEGFFTTVSIIGKDWRRVSGPWPTAQAASDVGRFAVSVVDAAMDRVSEVASPDVVKLRDLKAKGASFVVTETGGEWAIIWGHVNSPKFVDTELRYPVRELAEQALELARK